MPCARDTNTSHKALQVGGFVPFSTTDFPGKLAAVVFVQGCPWRCAYCHNPHLQARLDASPTPWDQVHDTLKRRIGLLDAVVFSGGEPTLDPALEEAVRTVRALGFQIGLHTAGIYPRRLAEVLPLVDWVGLDVKAPFADYEKITGIPGSGGQALECAQMILASGIAHEFRTTVHPDLISENELLSLATALSGMGVQHYALQLFRKEGCANTALLASTGEDALGEDTVRTISAIFAAFTT